MQEDRSSVLREEPVIDVPAISAGQDEGRGLYENDENVVRGEFERSGEPLRHAADARLAGAEPASYGGPRWSLASRPGGSRGSDAGTTARCEPMRFKHPEFRTTVTVGELIVTGVLPGTPRLRDAVQLPVGSIAIAGDVHHLSCDDALELADALMLVVLRMDGVTEERGGASTGANRDREG